MKRGHPTKGNIYMQNNVNILLLFYIVLHFFDNNYKFKLNFASSRFIMLELISIIFLHLLIRNYFVAFFYQELYMAGIVNL